ncbi:hypothetical protein IC235_13105 [Hymenobacter sp. BT664]|uniref:Uncharacterized protein n=1 Tax=Hymenobacter montanus TaxID=2771359 RepID=A0A927BF05_9BACT|nr:hypothetical protein [Hymenobacter montanus]MBD2768827.1 hypothetical protein [Hymenobacter montanus]
MPHSSPSLVTKGPSRVAHWAAVGGLVILLLLLGVFDELILQALTVFWQKSLAAVGLHRQVEALQRQVNGGITKRLLPAVASYTILYLGTCLLLLRVLLPTPAQWRVACQLYASVFAVYATIVLLNKLTGNTVWAYRLSRQLLDFIVSPLPVAGVYVLLRAGYKSQQQRP